MTLSGIGKKAEVWNAYRNVKKKASELNGYILSLIGVDFMSIFTSQYL